MKLLLTAILAVAALAVGAYGNDGDSGAYVVQGPHGGYNVIQAGGHPASIPFFGFHGFAVHAIALSHEKPKYILHPVTQDDGHGNKLVVYKKIYYRTAEEAEAAKSKQ